MVGLVKFVALLPLAAAYPMMDADFSASWSPAGDGDSRSPCPALNTMANHGILPHDGRGLTVPMLMSAMKKTFNIDADLSSILAIGGLAISPKPLSLKFDLEDLDKHNAIEHDASLSRADISEGGDNHSFNKTVWDTTMAFFDGKDTTDIETMAKARYNRVQTESSRDPDFTYDPVHVVVSYGESALLLSAMGDPIHGKVPVNFLKVFVEQERLPYKEGWRTPSTSINGITLNLMIPRLVAESGEALPEGVIISTNTIYKAFLGLENLAADIPKIIKSILGLLGINLPI